MAVQRRNNWVSQQRVDVPDMRAIESAVSNDFDQLLQGLILSNLEGYVLRGFDILMTGAVGGASNGLQMSVSNAAVLHPFSSQSGTFFVVPPGTPVQVLNSALNTQVSGAFTPSSQNFVGIEYSRSIDDTTAAQVYLWDPTINDETTSVIPRANILNFQIVISTGTWATNVLPVAIITTDAGNNVISVEDTRRLLFRLGTAGRTAPNPFYSYPWTAQPEGRVENPFISSSNSVNPFQGGDKMLYTYKDWQDAVMTKFKEITGSAFWYSAGSSSISGLNLTDIFFDAEGSVLTMRGKFTHSAVTPGQLTWSGDLHLRSIIGNLTYTIPPNTVTLNDGQVAYILLVRNQNFQASNTFTFNNGSATVSATTLIANIFPGDWIKFFSDDMSKWAQVLTVAGTNITLTAPYEGTTASGLALRSQGSYTMQVADPDMVPVSSDVYWIAKRDDNGSITATIDVPPVGAVRSGGITTFQTTAPHGINPGQGVQVAGVTDTTFNGLFEVLTTPDSTHFTVTNTGADGTSGNGTVTSTATIYLRGIGIVSQGQSSSDVSGAIEALLQYVGSSGPGDTQPQYSSTNYVTQGIDLTSAIGQLDLQAGTGTLITEQDRNLKLVRGGNWLFVNPNLSWSADAFIQVPGLPENRNRIPAGSIGLPTDGQVAYVEINRVAGAPANLTVSVALISALVVTNNTVIIARKFGGGGVSIGTEVGTLALTSPSQEWIDNDKLYVAGNGQLRIYDLSVTPAAPVFLGFVAIAGASSVTVVSNTAYVGGFSGGAGQFNVVDVTTPASPSVLGTASFSALEIIQEIRVIGTRAFAHTVTGIPVPTEVGDIRVVDVTTPASPTVVGTNTTYGGNVLGGNIERKVADTYLYKAGGDRVNIFDGTSNSAALLSDYMAGFIEADSIAVSSTHLFITDNINNQLTIHSLASPTAPVLVATLSVATAPYRIKVLANLAYIYHSVGGILTLVDITTPASPTVVYSAAHSVSTAELFPNDDLVYLLGTTTRIVQAIASGGSNQVVVGSHSFLLTEGESKELDAGLSQQNRTAIGFTSEAQSSPAWQTDHSAPLRTIASDSQDMISAVASVDTEIDKFFGQFRLKAANPTSSRIIVTNPDVTMLTGEKRSQQLSSLLAQTDGAQIDFQTGIIYKIDGVTVRGINFTPIVPAAGMYRWFSVGVVPAAANANNTLESQILVIAASADGASAVAAPKAPFSDGVLNLGQVVIFSSNGTTVSAIPQGSLVQLGVGSGSGSGSGSGVGDDLNALSFLASFTDDFSKLPDANAPVDISGGHTDSNTYSVVNQYYRIAYDASKTVTGTGTSMTLSGTPSFTVKVGDILRVDTEARRITVVTSQVLYTLESAFSSDPTAAPATVSQAVYTVDLNNYNFSGLAISDAFPDDIAQMLMYYQDSETQDDKTQDNGVPPNVAYIASTDGVLYSEVFTRPEDLSEEVEVVGLPTADDQLYVRFFSNKQTGSGFVNVLGYKVFLHREAAEESGSIPKLAYSRTILPVVGTQINCSTSVVGGVTRIRLLNDFTYPVGLAVPALRVLINGQDIDRFIDGPTSTDAYYLEIDERTIDLDSDYSAANLSLKIVFDVPVIDSSEQNASNLAGIDEVFEDKFQNIVDNDSKMLSPINGAPGALQFRSDINGRAPIPNLNQDLLPRMGINRIPIQNIVRMPLESGPNGEEVYSVNNDQFGQIRLVGGWNRSVDYNAGPIVISVLQNDYIEVVFVGTALNLLYDQVNFTTDMRVSVDGGAEGSNIVTGGGSVSPVLAGRHYNNNIILPVVKGLTYGQHTVKIRSNVNAGTIYLGGIEVITEDSAIHVPPGSAFSNGHKMTHASAETFSTNSGFDSGSLGTKGGRVIVYLNPDGSIGRACNPVDATQHTLFATDHSNEEVIRAYNWREFGSSRSDDFSFLTTSNQNVFSILNDDTTSLVGAGVSWGGSAHDGADDIHLDDVNDFLVINFVGSGLDVIRYESATGNDTIEYFLDGTSLSSASEAGFGKTRTYKLASGLPYCSHTVRIRKITQNNWSLSIYGYKVYGPKKPTLPSGAVQLADYNVVSDFVAQSTVGTDNLAGGIIRKFSAREISYIGAGWFISSNNTGVTGGFDAATATAGNYCEYTFFGTGFVRNVPNPDNAIVQINLNGVAANTTNYPTMLSSTFGSVSFVSGTGIMTDTSGTGNSGLNLYNLPLGLYTVRFTNTNGGGNGMHMGALDIITPIHSQKLNERGALQNTLSIGSQAMDDSREFSIIEDLPENKNWAEAKGNISNPGMGALSNPVPILDMLVTVRSKGALFQVSSSCTFLTNAGGGTVQMSLYVDGKVVNNFMEGQSYTNGGQFVNSSCSLLYLPPGEWTVGVYWFKGGAGSAMTSPNLSRILNVRET